MDRRYCLIHLDACRLQEVHGLSYVLEQLLQTRDFSYYHDQIFVLQDPAFGHDSPDDYDPLCHSASRDLYFRLVLQVLLYCSSCLVEMCSNKASPDLDYKRGVQKNYDDFETIY